MLVIILGLAVTFQYLPSTTNNEYNSSGTHVQAHAYATIHS